MKIFFYVKKLFFPYLCSIIASALYCCPISSPLPSNKDDDWGLPIYVSPGYVSLVILSISNCCHDHLHLCVYSPSFVICNWWWGCIGHTLPASPTLYHRSSSMNNDKGGYRQWSTIETTKIKSLFMKKWVHHKMFLKLTLYKNF